MYFVTNCWFHITLIPPSLPLLFSCFSLSVVSFSAVARCAVLPSSKFQLIVLKLRGSCCNCRSFTLWNRDSKYLLYTIFRSNSHPDPIKRINFLGLFLSCSSPSSFGCLFLPFSRGLEWGCNERITPQPPPQPMSIWGHANNALI